jgi:hypothetical protein
MKIGYSVEGSTDRAFLKGLQQRWCPQAEMIEGRFRGSTGLSRHREIPSICVELASKGTDLIIFLRDANDEAWRDVRKKDQEKCSAEYRHLAVFAVCDRNIESWFCRCADWLAERTGWNADRFRTPDPKNAFEKAFEITARERKEEEIATIVAEAPLREWLSNPSFESFYGELWLKSKEQGCQIENLRERK